METIKNLAGTAGSYIYGSGQSGTEPVSGETGKGTATEPYDQGNKAETTGVTTNHSDGSQGSGVKTSEHDESRPNTHTGNIGNSEPSVGADTTSGHSPQVKQQGADKPLAEPKGSEAEAISKKTEKAEDAMAKRDPNDHSGEPMQMHGEDNKDNEQEKPGQEGGGEHGKDTGTGEQWVKTSGLAAEGGNFDATKPGAGKEANRILEEKGINKEKGDDVSQSSGSNDPGTPDSSKKTSKLGKIKDKLHIGKH